MATKSKSLTTEEAANRELTKQAEAERKRLEEERALEVHQDQAAPDQQVASILTEPRSRLTTLRTLAVSSRT
jgi:hypothetical protein